ncbi:MAG: hypothetical protein HC783_15945 [Rhodobacteraceae bacterium]|nr:hypothetical protein [Paracoccaceae bacterium]
MKGYPTAFLAAIDKAMSIFPKDRLQSVAEWQAMLRGTDNVAVPVAAKVVSRPPMEESASVRVKTAPLPQAMRPQRALLSAVMVPAAAGALLLAGIMAVPGDLWQRIGVMQDAPAMVFAGSTPAAQAPSGEAFAQQHAVRLPFVGDPQDPTRVMARLPWSPDWIQPGQRIVEVNGAPVQDGASIPALMAAGVDLAQMSEVNVIFGYEDKPGGNIVNKMASLPVVARLQLENGLMFEMESVGTTVRTVVASVPESAADGGLRMGDVLVSYAATGETLGTETALREILLREVANKVATYGFAVQRAEGIAVGSFTLPGVK